MLVKLTKNITFSSTYDRTNNINWYLKKKQTLCNRKEIQLSSDKCLIFFLMGWNPKQLIWIILFYQATQELSHRVIKVSAPTRRDL